MPEIYLSYLFRYWQCGDNDPACRITLEDPHTREITAFTELDDCMAHLQKRINDQQKEAGIFKSHSPNPNKGENIDV